MYTYMYVYVVVYTGIHSNNHPDSSHRTTYILNTTRQSNLNSRPAAKIRDTLFQKSPGPLLEQTRVTPPLKNLLAPNLWRSVSARAIIRTNRVHRNLYIYIYRLWYNRAFRCCCCNRPTNTHASTCALGHWHFPSSLVNYG